MWIGFKTDIETPATIEQILAAIAAAHRAEGIPSPTETLLVKKTLKGYRREHGTAPRKKDAATIEVVRMLLAATARDDSPKNIQNAAIISLGFARAFRRSELSAHSLRSGFVTTAIRQGKTERAIISMMPDFLSRLLTVSVGCAPFPIHF